MVAVIATVLSVAVGKAGGESVLNMSVVWCERYVVTVAAVRVVVVHFAPWVEDARVHAFLTVAVYVPVVVPWAAKFESVTANFWRLTANFLPLTLSVSAKFWPVTWCLKGMLEDVLGGVTRKKQSNESCCSGKLTVTF